jgi:hypothetical protein
MIFLLRNISLLFSSYKINDPTTSEADKKKAKKDLANEESLLNDMRSFVVNMDKVGTVWGDIPNKFTVWNGMKFLGVLFIFVLIWKGFIGFINMVFDSFK